MIARNILFFVGALGAFNGILLALYFLFVAKRRNLSSFFLGCLLAALSLRIGKAVVVYFDPALPKIYFQIGLSACLLIGPALFFFIKASAEQPAQVPRSWKLQIAVLCLAILLLGLLYPYSVYPSLWNQYFIKVIYAVWGLYVLASGFVLKPLFVRMRNQKAAIKPAEKWQLAIYSANLVICLSFVLALLFNNVYQTYYGGAILFSLVLYCMIFVHLYQSKSTDPFYVVPPKSSAKKVPDTTATVVIEGLEQLMNKAQLFKNPNLTVSELAKAVNLPAHQLSQLLNDHLGRNFTSYVNEYRIEEACRMIAEGHPFSLEAIGYEVGFNSKSTFYTAFKKLKATTPLQYKEDLSKKGAASLTR